MHSTEYRVFKSNKVTTDYKDFNRCRVCGKRLWKPFTLCLKHRKELLETVKLGGD